MIIEMKVMKERIDAIMVQSYRREVKQESEWTPLDFLESFCHLIGNKDSMLREDLMKPVFRTFGENDETFCDKEAQGILEKLTGPDNMSYAVEKGQTLLIFKRSYSALVIASLLWRQSQKPFMSRTALQVIHERMQPGFMTRHTA